MKRISLLLSAALAFTGAASAQMQGGFSQGYPQQGGNFGQPSSYQSLSGVWYDPTGGAMQVQVDASGRLISQMSPGTTMQGQFQGMMGRAIVTHPDSYNPRKKLQYTLDLRFDGECHIQAIPTYVGGKRGQPMMFHVNHQPNQSC